MLLSNRKLSQTVCLTGIALALDFLALSSYFPALAEKSEKKENSVELSYQGLPSNRRDGGSRGNCVANGKDFVALVPDTPVNATASISSQLFFYVPQTEKPKTIEFVLRTKEDQLVYEAFVQTTGQGGIMSVEIPDQIQDNLTQNLERYHWYLSMICDPDQRSRDIVLQGWIKYVELDNSVKEKIDLSNPIEKSNLLQERGVWYDALTVLAEQKKLGSNVVSLKTQWSQLLESIGLVELASEPLITTEITDNFYPTAPKEY